jgi:hypothetical protein
VAERAPASRACPFDLHRLLPVPEAVPALGPQHPDALRWLWAQWGTTQALRHVVELPISPLGRRRSPDPLCLWVGFWSADWTPWRAITALRHRRGSVSL